MARRQLKTEDVDGFMRAVWDEVRDTEIRYGVRFQIEVHMGERRGDVKFVAKVWKADESPPESPIAAVDRVYPSHRYTSLHALLYSLVSGANIVVQRDWHDRTGEWYSGPTDESGRAA